MTIIEVECTPSTDPIVEQNKQNLRTNTLTTLGMSIFHIYVSYRKFYWYTKSPDKLPKNINKQIYKIIFQVYIVVYFGYHMTPKLTIYYQEYGSYLWHMVIYYKIVTI